MQRKLWRLGILCLVAAGLLLQGCGSMTKFKNWVAGTRGEDETAEEAVPPEAKQEEVLVDGKPYVRSKNPYWLSYPDQPEYIYLPKGTEFRPFQQRLVDAVAKAVGAREKTAAPGIPPEKVQEMVRVEVERILREQVLGGYVSRPKGEKAPYAGRAAAAYCQPSHPQELRRPEPHPGHQPGGRAGTPEGLQGDVPGPGEGGPGQGNSVGAGITNDRWEIMVAIMLSIGEERLLGRGNRPAGRGWLGPRRCPGFGGTRGSPGAPP